MRLEFLSIQLLDPVTWHHMGVSTCRLVSIISYLNLSSTCAFPETRDYGISMHSAPLHCQPAAKPLALVAPFATSFISLEDRCDVLIITLTIHNQCRSLIPNPLAAEKSIPTRLGSSWGSGLCDVPLFGL